MHSLARIIEAPGRLSPIVELPAPAPRRGEVRLRVHATSVNYHDLMGVDGQIPGLPVPRVPFSDASATIEAIGEGARRFAVGDRVIPNFFPHWTGGPISADVMAVLGDQLDGTLQTLVCVPEYALARAPVGLSHAEAATLGCAGLTAWRVLFVEAGLRPGQTVLLQGTGGVSLIALGLAKMAGARVILTSSSDEKLKRARALGADELINYRTHPDWAAVAQEMTGGTGVDVVIDVGGTATLGQSIAAVRIGGHIGVVGVLTGMDAPSLPIVALMGRNIAVKGVTVGSRTDLDAMCRAIDLGGFRPVIDRVFPLAGAHDAIELMRGQGHFGKIVIEMPCV